MVVLTPGDAEICKGRKASVPAVIWGGILPGSNRKVKADLTCRVFASEKPSARFSHVDFGCRSLNGLGFRACAKEIICRGPKTVIVLFVVFARTSS